MLITVFNESDNVLLSELLLLVMLLLLLDVAVNCEVRGGSF